MKRDIYLDGIQQVHFLSGMVRLDMFTLSPQADADPTQEDAGRLIMNPQGFLAMLDTMQNFATKLVEAGVLQKKQP